MKTRFFRTLSLFLSLFLLLTVLCACKKTENKTETEGVTNPPVSEPEENEMPDEFDLLSATRSCLAYSETGEVEDPALQKLTLIRSAADFEPYRALFAGSDQSEIGAILSEEYLSGYAALLEVIVPNPETDYSLATVYREGIGIHVVLTLNPVDEEAEPSGMAEKHAFFLFAVDRANYHGEEVEFYFEG